MAVDLSATLLQELTDRGQATDLIDLIDPTGEADPIGIVEHRICGGVTLHVDGIGDWSWSADELSEAGGASMLQEGLFTLSVGDPEEVALLSTISSTPFALSNPWALTDSGFARMSFSTEDPTRIGGAVSGEITFDRCVVTQRMPGASDVPSLLELEVSAEGVFELVELPGMVLTSNPFDLVGRLPAAVFGGGALYDTLEVLCEGGYGYVP